MGLDQWLGKLKILVEPSQGRPLRIITAMFNPNQITIQKSANWQSINTKKTDVAPSQFTYGEPATLNMDLLFDTYELGIDVRVFTRQVFALTTIEQHGKKHRPPVCELFWGTAGVFFQGVLTSLTQRFTLFLPTGTPVRATLGCSFKEWRSKQEGSKRVNTESVDVAKTWIVRKGDSLSSIAAEEYNDPILWRPIAAANGIDNPLMLEPGAVLSIPSLRPGGTAG